MKGPIQIDTIIIEAQWKNHYNTPHNCSHNVKFEKQYCKNKTVRRQATMYYKYKLLDQVKLLYTAYSMLSFDKSCPT